MYCTIVLVFLISHTPRLVLNLTEFLVHGTGNRCIAYSTGLERNVDGAVGTSAGAT